MPAMSDNAMIRAVKKEDATQLTSIYNYYIRTSIVTFEEEEIETTEMERRIDRISQKANYPYLVYEVDGVIQGYAYGDLFRQRNAYRFAVETTVYLHPDHFGAGIGTRLYTQLIDALRTAGFHSAIGVISLPNDASTLLHEKSGFKKIGHFTEVGLKFDRWIDVGFWELLL